MQKVHKGFLLLSAAVLLIIGAVVALLTSHMVNTDTQSATNDSNSTQAFYIASAGLERVLQAVTTDNLSDRVACADITNNANFTNATIGSGTFTVTATSATVSSATLSSALTSSSTIIPVSSVANYVGSGQIMVDAELVSYDAISTSNASCAGSAPCFIQVTRGAGGTSAAAHAINSQVVQNRCELVSTGTVSANGAEAGKRILSVDVFQLEYGWLVGNTYNGSENILTWDGGAWAQAANSDDIPDVHYYGMQMLNYANGWIVGQNSDGDATLLHYDGSLWTRVLPDVTVPNVDLNDIECISSDDCWAVGDAKTFIHWNGASWTAGVVDAALPNKMINAVTCTASNNCWAVGLQDGSDPFFIFWDGASWSQVVPTGLPNAEFNDVTCLASNNCWAVGGGSSFAYWNGTAWSNVLPDADVPNKDIRSISCLSSDNCWAVGAPQAGSSLIVHWNGSSWSRVTPDAEVPNSSLYGVSCANSNDCWAVGNSGVVIHWDGISWKNGNIGDQPTGTLHSIYILGSLDGSPLITNWTELA